MQPYAEAATVPSPSSSYEDKIGDAAVPVILWYLWDCLHRKGMTITETHREFQKVFKSHRYCVTPFAEHTPHIVSVYLREDPTQHVTYCIRNLDNLKKMICDDYTADIRRGIDAEEEEEFTNLH